MVAYDFWVLKVYMSAFAWTVRLVAEQLWELAKPMCGDPGAQKNVGMIKTTLAQKTRQRRNRMQIPKGVGEGWLNTGE